MSFDNILRTKQIDPSAPWTTMDSSYGHGWYFTDREPATACNAWTVAHCWRRLDIFNRVEYYLKFDVADHVLKKCREHVWMISAPQWDGTIDGSWPVVFLEGKKNPGCTKAVSCLVCDVIGKVKQFFGLK